MVLLENGEEEMWGEGGGVKEGRGGSVPREWNGLMNRWFPWEKGEKMTGRAGGTGGGCRGKERGGGGCKLEQGMDPGRRGVGTLGQRLVGTEGRGGYWGKMGLGTGGGGGDGYRVKEGRGGGAGEGGE